MDPLLLLRASLSRGATITLLAAPPSASPSSTPTEEVYALPLATHIAFPSTSTTSPRPIFPKTTPTRYLTNASSTETYDLQTLLLVFLHRDASTANYMKIVREGNFGFVSAIDRKMVVDWLSGKSPLEGPPGRILPLEGAGKRAADVVLLEGSADKVGGVGASPMKKQRYLPDAVDQAKVKRLMAVIQGPQYGYMVEGKVDKAERKGGVIKDRQTVLKGERVNVSRARRVRSATGADLHVVVQNFDSARALVQSRLKIQRDEQHRSTSGAVLAPTSSAPVPAGKPKKKNLNPIIIISPSSTALITMHNVKRFLEDSMYAPSLPLPLPTLTRRRSFEPSDEARVSSLPGGNGSIASKSAEDVIVVNHLRTTASVSQTGIEPRKGRYIIVDGVEALSKFGGLDEAWCVVHFWWRINELIEGTAQGTSGVRDDDGAGVAV